MTAGFQDPLRVENIDAKNWFVLTRLRWVGTKGDIFDVEAGEVTDFATVPWWSQFVTPRTGTWTLSAVLHDKMCNQLNEYRKLKKEHDDLITGWRMLNELSGLNQEEPIGPVKPRFSSVDTDAIFRKNAREGGTDLIRSELLWFGVRCGALTNTARREAWLSTFWRWLFDLVVILAVLTIVVASVSWLWPW